MAILFWNKITLVKVVKYKDENYCIFYFLYKDGK